jgi:hypothetical protein
VIDPVTLAELETSWSVSVPQLNSFLLRNRARVALSPGGFSALSVATPLSVGANTTLRVSGALSVSIPEATGPELVVASGGVVTLDSLAALVPAPDSLAVEVTGGSSLTANPGSTLVPACASAVRPWSRCRASMPRTSRAVRWISGSGAE